MAFLAVFGGLEDDIIILTLMLLVLLAANYYLYSHYSFKAFHVPDVAKVVKYFAIGLCASIVLNAAQLQSIPIIDIPETLQFYLESSIISKIIYFVLLCVAGPIIEEMFYTGLIYRVAKIRLGGIYSAALTITFFTLMHGLDNDNMVKTAAVSLMSIYMYEKSGSLVTSMLTHSIFNAIWLLFTYIGYKF